jgi:hypothetical protein
LSVRFLPERAADLVQAVAFDLGNDHDPSPSWADRILDRKGLPAALLAGVVCLSPLGKALEECISEGWGVLHAEQSFEYFRLPQPDREVAARAEVVRTRAVRESTVVVVASRAFTDNEQIVSGKSTLFFSRGNGVPPSTERSRNLSEKEATERPLGLAQKQTVDLSGTAPGLGSSSLKASPDSHGAERSADDSSGRNAATTEALTYSRRAELADLVRYAAASGDFNPIHFDYEVAQNSGFPKPLVHGMLVYGWTLSILATHVSPELPLQARVRFQSPLMLGEEARIRLGTDLTFVVSGPEDRIVARGSFQSSAGS